jgi:hypothetical protein
VSHTQRRESVDSAWPSRRRRLKAAVRSQVARLLGRAGRNGREYSANTSQAASPRIFARMARPTQSARIARATRYARPTGHMRPERFVSRTAEPRNGSTREPARRPSRTRQSSLPGQRQIGR